MAEILTDETFAAKVEKGSGLALVDFYADWCVPCQQQGPIIMLFKDGVKQEESLGVTDKATLEAMLAKYL